MLPEPNLENNYLCLPLLPHNSFKVSQCSSSWIEAPSNFNQSGAFDTTSHPLEGRMPHFSTMTALLLSLSKHGNHRILAASQNCLIRPPLKKLSYYYHHKTKQSFIYFLCISGKMLGTNISNITLREPYHKLMLPMVFCPVFAALSF